MLYVSGCVRIAKYAGSLKKLKEAKWNRRFSLELYCRTITAVGHRSLGLPSARKFAHKRKVLSLLVIRDDIKRSREREKIPMHRTAIKTVISGRIDVGVNVTCDSRDARFRSTWLECLLVPPFLFRI